MAKLNISSNLRYLNMFSDNSFTSFLLMMLIVLVRSKFSDLLNQKLLIIDWVTS